jgi:hypothetical protein
MNLENVEEENVEEENVEEDCHNNSPQPCFISRCWLPGSRQQNRVWGLGFRV